MKLFSNDYVSILDKRIQNGTFVEENGVSYFKNKMFNDPAENIDNAIIEWSSDFDDSNLVLFTDSSTKSSLSNAISLYETYTLTPLQASNRGFWTYLSLHTFAEYNKEKYPVSKDKGQYYYDHYVLSKSPTGMMRHTLAGLWWAVYVSIDNTRRDKYELTKVLFRQISFFARFFSPNLLSIKPVVSATLQFILDNEEIFSAHFESRMRLINIIINRIGGVKLISTMDVKYFYNELNRYKKLLSNITTRQDVSKYLSAYNDY
jgi:hypothetical protein